jgi:hypothetical protein
MRLFRSTTLAFTVLAATGCGTFHNLDDSPNGPLYLGMGCCYPFGGVARSSLLAVMGPPTGVVGIIEGDTLLCQGKFAEGFEQIGQGLFLGSAGLIAIADAPLSLAGDVLTFPIAYARSREYPWATWWGKEPVHISDATFAPAKDVADQKTDSTAEPTH